MSIPDEADVAYGLKGQKFFSENLGEGRGPHDAIHYSIPKEEDSGK